MCINLTYYAMTRQGDTSLYPTDRIQIGSTVLNNSSKNGVAKDELVLSVCHGLGGDDNGSDAASSSVCNVFANNSKILQDDDVIRNCIKSNDVVHFIQSFGKEYLNIATTLTGLSIHNNKYKLFNVGDSCVYKLENGIIFSEFWCDEAFTDQVTAIPKKHIGAFGRDSWPEIREGSIAHKDTYFIILSSGYSKLFSKHEIKEAFDMYSTFHEFACNCNRIAVLRNPDEDISSIFIHCKKQCVVD